MNVAVPARPDVAAGPEEIERAPEGKSEQWMGKKKKKMEWVNALRKNVTFSFVASRRQ